MWTFVYSYSYNCGYTFPWNIAFKIIYLHYPVALPVITLRIDFVIHSSLNTITAQVGFAYIYSNI